ncbi:MAG: InlB B-repeat-containing protein [Candidatus Nanopelagicales bacterium]|nr:InlB B-repeat-containing protein [Candidatus Nanopelagicales bacterium]
MRSAYSLKNLAFATVLAVLFTIFSPVIGSWNPSRPASASSVDFTGEYLNFDASTMVVLNGNSTSPTVGNTFLYPSAGVIEGVSVDVTVEIVASINQGGSNGFTWDAESSSQFNGVTLNQDQKDLLILSMENYDVVFRYKFWESGTAIYASSAVTGIAVELKNLLVNTYDLDNDQWVAFSSFQQYEVNNVSPVNVSLISGTTLAKFLGPSSNYSGTDSFTKGRARVIYDQVSTVDIRVNAPGNSLYGIQFGAGVEWSTFDNFANSFNVAPTSSDTTKYLVPGTASTLNVADFGDYSDTDNNPFFDVKFEASSDLGGMQYFDGTSTVSPAAGSTVSVEAIAAGRLSYLLPSATAATVSFRVGDGLTYSPAIYSLNLLPATQPQVITFPEVVGSIDPNSGAFSSSATTSSTLQVTLTSNTPSVCTIDANGTDIIPQITSARSACSVTATQDGDATFASAEPVTRIFYFSNQVITFPAISDQAFISGGAISSSAVADSTLPVTLTSLNTAICTISGLDIQFVATGSCNVRAEQAGGSTGSPSVTYVSAFPVVRSFQLTSFNLTYDANTGTGTAPSDLVSVTTATVGTGSLVKGGFDFAGWNSNSTGSGTDYATGSSIALTSNLTLFAKWVATLTFDSQGGSAVPDEQYVFGQTATTLPTANKSGYGFQGWALTPSGDVIPGTYSSGSATLYAIWSGGGSELPAPVYNGPVVILVAPDVVPTAGGDLITVTGKRLGVGQHVVINGLQLPLASSTQTEFSFLMPSMEEGVWDLLYVYDGGARLTILRAITTVEGNSIVSAPGQEPASTVSPEQTLRPWSAKDVASKFAPGSPVINKWVRTEVVLMLRKYSSIATHIDCTGFTMGPTVLSVDAKLSMDRAVAVCGLIKKLRPRLEVISMQGKQELRLGGEIRRVEVRFFRR